MKESDSLASSPGKTWSETRRGRIIIFGGMMVLFALVFWMSLRARRMVMKLPMLVVDEKNLSFGEVWETPEFVWILPIRNTTDDNIEIVGFATDCPCSKIEPSSITVPAQGSAEVRMTLDLCSSSTNSLTPLLRDFKVSVQPHIRKGTKTRSIWIVHGKVKQLFTIEPPVLDFEEKLVRGQNFMPTTITIICRTEVDELKADCDSPFCAVKTTKDVDHLSRFRVEVQPREDMPVGRFEHQLRLTALTQSKHKITARIPVVGRVVEDVSLQPESIAFGAQAVGTKMQESVMLQSRSGQQIEIQKIDNEEANNITVDLDRTWKDGRNSCIICCPVDRPGNQKHTIHITVKTRQGLLNLPLHISYYGIVLQNAAVKK